jgi:hypothetical protein
MVVQNLNSRLLCSLQEMNMVVINCHFSNWKIQKSILLQKCQDCLKILWHVDPLLRGDCKIGDCTAATARHQPATNNRGTVFSVWCVPRCYKHDNWSKIRTVHVTKLPL